MKPVIIYLTAIVFLSSCSGIPKETKESLARMTKENRIKFKRVIRHYSADKDSLKRKAVFFLINSIEDFSFKKGSAVEEYNKAISVLELKPDEWKRYVSWSGDEVKNIFDSVFLKNGQPDISTLKEFTDVNKITEQDFLDNVDLAFKMWQKPWARHATFDEFCEYILPYRTYNEPLENWRGKYIARFKYAEKLLKDSTDVLGIGKLISDSAQIRYHTVMESYPGPMAPSLLLRTPFGLCSDVVNYKILAMRSLGIPVMADFVTSWGNGYNGHYWNAILDNNGNTVSFSEALNDDNSRVAYNMQMAKVFRKTYSRQKDRIELLIRCNGDVPECFRDIHAIDVTKQYVAVNDVKLHLKEIPGYAKYAYLAVFNKELYPIDYGIINGDMVQFNNVGRNVCYFPVYYRNGNIESAASPFILTEKGFVKELKPGEKTEEMTLTRKFTMEKRRENWLRSMLGVKIQLANKPDFSDARTIYSISELPAQHLTKIKCNASSGYRYVRFLFSPEKHFNTSERAGDTCGACIAEIVIKDFRGNKLEGKVITSTCGKYDEYKPENALDNDIVTFFENTSLVYPKYLGIDLGASKQIASVSYCPRNDKNSVQSSNKYELMYWKDSNFVSAGVQEAKDTMVIFNDIPANTVYWLRNLTEGKEERIFTYEGGKQVWW